MTNQERQKSLNNKYESGKEKRGKAPWCSVCKHKLPKGGCRIKIDKANQECICATTYNRYSRGN